ncbi:MAG: hypothetical protein QOG25_3779, partial [Acetobacteraceae bacterium]|nr:hypothetical protein [Acetobacteraceae bacterium]
MQTGSGTGNEATAAAIGQLHVPPR